MNTTPQSNRLTVSILGRANSGKSSLFNAITGTDNAIVSALPGTTTDPVAKSMELLPHGPIVLIDTAGLGDSTALGDARQKKTQQVLERTDLALVAVDPLEPDEESTAALLAELDRRKIEHLVLLTKRDAVSEEQAAALLQRYPDALWVAAGDAGRLHALKAAMSNRLDVLSEDHPLLAGLLPAGAVAILVVPVDSEAPKGRLILPQVQVIRECLDAGVRCHVTTERQLPVALEELERVDLVITDSQAFHEVAAMVPEEIPLTGFSILMARQKCELDALEEGVRALESLEDGDRVLIAETCTHNHTHEDIGRVKIPRLLSRRTGKELHFDFCAGRDYPDNLAEYRVVVHCGGCMITRREMMNRVRAAREQGVPVTNYGLALAWGSGMLERSLEIVRRARKEGVPC